MTYETIYFADVKVGDKIPAIDIDITSSLITCGALATRDFEPCHHVTKVAQDMGLPDVFMNILTSQALMARYVTDWSGPEAVMKGLNVKLGAPNVPGMIMNISGVVAEVDEAAQVVKVDVLGENNIWGMHMQGSVSVKLP